MFTAEFARALARADRGLDWSYPCLIWVADFLADATGRDPAAAWRGTVWTAARAQRALARQATLGQGATLVEQALDAIAHRDGWRPAEGPMQGALMVGVYEAEPFPAEWDAGQLTIGVPAIFDGQRRWAMSNTGRGWTVTLQPPLRMWEVVI